MRTAVRARVQRRPRPLRTHRCRRPSTSERPPARRDRHQTRSPSPRSRTRRPRTTLGVFAQIDARAEPTGPRKRPVRAAARPGRELHLDGVPQREHLVCAGAGGCRPAPDIRLQRVDAGRTRDAELAIARDSRLRAVAPRGPPYTGRASASSCSIADGLVFVGRRARERGDEVWQFPQGGIDDGEDAARRARYGSSRRRPGSRARRTSSCSQTLPEHRRVRPARRPGEPADVGAATTAASASTGSRCGSSGPTTTIDLARRTRSSTPFAGSRSTRRSRWRSTSSATSTAGSARGSRRSPAVRTASRVVALADQRNRPWKAAVLLANGPVQSLANPDTSTRKPLQTCTSSTHFDRRLARFAIALVARGPRGPRVSRHGLRQLTEVRRRVRRRGRPAGRTRRRHRRRGHPPGRAGWRHRRRGRPAGRTRRRHRQLTPHPRSHAPGLAPGAFSVTQSRSSVRSAALTRSSRSAPTPVSAIASRDASRASPSE